LRWPKIPPDVLWPLMLFPLIGFVLWALAIVWSLQ
jgi:hypothetical protein